DTLGSNDLLEEAVRNSSACGFSQEFRPMHILKSVDHASLLHCLSRSGTAHLLQRGPMACRLRRVPETPRASKFQPAKLEPGRCAYPFVGGTRHLVQFDWHAIFS